MKTPHPASFRDPDGEIFAEENTLYRQINSSYRKHYETLMNSGLYEHLRSQGYLVAHEEVRDSNDYASRHFKTIRPEKIPFITYPYEWCFTQYKQAARLTLEIQRIALEHGMTLKDASAFNIQFLHGRPVLIDTLSFECYDEGKPWVAYRQFCEHFLAPLVLAAYSGPQVIGMMRSYVNGMPLDVACRLLPARCRLRPSLAVHLYLHAKSASMQTSRLDSRVKMSLASMQKFVENLDDTISSLRLSDKFSTGEIAWDKYYKNLPYNEEGFEHKTRFVKSCLERLSPAVTWDIGCNTGQFSLLAARFSKLVVAMDNDNGVIEHLFRDIQQSNEKHITPIVMNIADPSPSLGWAHEERDSLLKRGPADLILALALVHHLYISNYIPFSRQAEYFSMLGDSLIVEFVGPEDPMASQLLARRPMMKDLYTQQNFEEHFSTYYSITEKETVSDTRTLYLMRGK